MCVSEGVHGEVAIVGELSSSSGRKMAFWERISSASTELALPLLVRHEGFSPYCRGNKQMRRGEHRRSVVAVGAVDSYSKLEHTVSASQTLCEVGVGACTSYSSTVQLRKGTHRVSLSTVQGLKRYSLAVQLLQGRHTVSADKRQGVAVKVAPSSQELQGAHSRSASCGQRRGRRFRKRDPAAHTHRGR